MSDTRRRTSSISEMLNPRVSITSAHDYPEALEYNRKSIDSQDSNNNRFDEAQSGESTSSRIYWIYLKSGAGLLLLPILLCSNLITQTLFTGSDYWLSQWTNYHENKFIQSVEQNYTFEKSPLIDSDQNNNIIIYSSIVGGLFVFSILRTITFFTICMRASVNLHNRLFASVIRAPISFFDNNPIGILMNRCSRDLGIIDDLLPPTAFDAIELLVNCIAIVILCTFMDYWILIPSFVLLIIFILIRRFFMATARRLKKVEGIARSPVLSHLSTSLYGLTTIRSFGTQSNFIKKFDSLQDKHTSAYFLYLCSTRWFGIVLDDLCVVYIIALTILLVMTISDRTGSEVGLSISQALMLTSAFQWGVRQNAEVETQMTSVERVVEFSNLEKEDDIENKPPEG